MYKFSAFAIATTFIGAFLSAGNGENLTHLNVAKLHQQII
jgi:hypothetical protein